MNGNSTCNRGEHFLAGIGIRPVRLGKGEVLHGHKHNQDHVTVVTRGSIRVRTWRDCECTATTREYASGEFFNVEADWFHETTGLEDDNRHLCMFASPDSKSLEDAFWDMAEARV